MNRPRTWIPMLSLLLLSSLLFATLRAAGSMARASDAGGQVASLKDQLEKGLRARRPIEFQFVGQIVQLVNSGVLSREMVLGSFSWTLKKYSRRKYLVPYFEQHLRQRAARAGITALNNIPSTLTVN